MTPDNALKALRLLARVPRALTAIEALPGLDPVDVRILSGIAAHAVLLARRMEDRAKGANMARVVRELQHSVASIREMNPLTDKVQ